MAESKAEMIREYYAVKYDDAYTLNIFHTKRAAKAEKKKEGINCIEKSVVPVYLITAEEYKEYMSLSKKVDALQKLLMELME